MPGAPRWRAVTVAIDDPGPLIDYLPPEGGCAFLNRGEGFVAFGEVARFTTDFPAAADVWWSEFVAEVEHETELPGEYGTGPLALGSFTFDPDNSTDLSVLVIPEVIVGRRDGLCWVTKVGRTRPDEKPPKRSEPPVPPSNLRIVGGAKEESWQSMVSEVMSLLSRGSAERVVLARDLLVRSDQPIDPRSLVAHLSRSYPECWTFLVDDLVGSTPELLVRVRGSLVTSRVLTGAASASSEERLDLIAADSERRQDHAAAVLSATESLRPHCKGMHVPEAPFLLCLPNICQLATDVTGVVDEDASSLALAGALHPTYAVCGAPRAAALDLIGEFEDIDRGRYAGPIGWVDASGDGEWAIALRCGQYIGRDQLQLFAAVGVTATGDAAAKVAATRAKFAPMLDALGAAPPA